LELWYTMPSSLQGECRAGGHVSIRPAGLPHPWGATRQGSSTYSLTLLIGFGWFWDRQADWHYQRGEYQRCYDVAQGLLETDPYHLTCLPVYLAATLELRRKNELFLRAHKLMEEYPDR